MTARNFHQIWREQCEAARNIRDRFGVDSALEYLIREKLMNFAEAAETRPEFVCELPAFTREIRSIFAMRELEEFFERGEHAATEFTDDDADDNEPDSAEERLFLAQREKEARDRTAWVKAMILNRGS